MYHAITTLGLFVILCVPAAVALKVGFVLYDNLWGRFAPTFGERFLKRARQIQKRDNASEHDLRDREHQRLIFKALRDASNKGFTQCFVRLDDEVSNGTQIKLRMDNIGLQLETRTEGTWVYIANCRAQVLS